MKKCASVCPGLLHEETTEALLNLQTELHAVLESRAAGISEDARATAGHVTKLARLLRATIEELRQMKQERIRLHAEHTKLDAALLCAREGRAAKESQLLQLETGIAGVQQELELKREELELKREELGSTREELRQLAEETRYTEQQVQLKIAETAEQVKSVCVMFVHQQAQLHSNRQKLGEVRTELGEVGKKLRSEQEQLRTRREKLDRVSTELDRVSTELDRVSKELDHASKARDGALRAQELKSQELKSLLIQVDAQDLELSRAKEQLEQLRERAAGAEADARAELQRYEELTRELEAEQARVRDTVRQTDLRREELSAARDCLGAARDDLSAARDELSAARDELRALRNQLRAADSELHIARNGKQELQAAVAALREESAALQADAERKRAELQRVQLGLRPLVESCWHAWCGVLLLNGTYRFYRAKHDQLEVLVERARAEGLELERLRQGHAEAIARGRADVLVKRGELHTLMAHLDGLEQQIRAKTALLATRETAPPLGGVPTYDVAIAHTKASVRIRQDELHTLLAHHKMLEDEIEYLVSEMERLAPLLDYVRDRLGQGVAVINGRIRRVVNTDVQASVNDMVARLQGVKRPEDVGGAVSAAASILAGTAGRDGDGEPVIKPSEEGMQRWTR
jgi:chromosome segregation ATPase